MLGWFAADPAAAKVHPRRARRGRRRPRASCFQADFARFIKLIDDGLDAGRAGPGLPHATGARRRRRPGPGLRGGRPRPHRRAAAPAARAHLRAAGPLRRRRGRPAPSSAGRGAGRRGGVTSRAPTRAGRRCAALRPRLRRSCCCRRSGGRRSVPSLDSAEPLDRASRPRRRAGRGPSSETQETTQPSSISTWTPVARATQPAVGFDLELTGARRPVADRPTSGSRQQEGRLDVDLGHRRRAGPQVDQLAVAGGGERRRLPGGPTRSPRRGCPSPCSAAASTRPAMRMLESRRSSAG